MRYLSVCSGIEAASVAWHHLGWTPVAFSEIEPFPAAVLKHRFPDVPNYGDMTKHKEWPLEPGSIDLLVGGTPCQSFSVAGLRKGLSDPRGGLMLTYLEIAQRLRPKWILWENVPGVLSASGGRDFGSFLGALSELRYGWAYRVIDAQYCRVDGRWPKAVPQRRRRVFVVGCLLERDPRGRERAAEVLALGTGLRWHLAESGKTRKAAPADAEAGVGAGCVTSHDVAPCLETTCHDYSRADGFTMVAGTLGNRGLRSHTELDGHGAYIPVPFTKAKRAQSTTDDETWVDGKVNPTLSLFDQGDTRATTVAVAFAQNQVGEVRTGDVSGTLNTNSNASGRNTPMAAVAFTPGNLARGAGPSPNAEVAPTQRCSAGRGADDQRTCVAFDWQSGGDSRGLDPKDTAQLQRCQTPAVAFTRCDNGRDASVEVTPTMRCGSNYSAHPAVAFNDTSATLKGGSGERGYPDPSDGNGHGIVGSAMTVRRLTPRECERLQGFPDDWTLIPWRKKPADECPDGPRYKALGNSMAVNCMAWIGERIDASEAHHAGA